MPTLHADLMIAYIRNPQKFPINKYINVRKVDKQIGYYVQFENAAQARITSDDIFNWADGADAPTNGQNGGDRDEFKQFNCRRRLYTDYAGYLAVQQGAWDVLTKKAAEQTMLGMTARSKRIATTLTTTGNYPSANVLTASVTGGATWANATSSLPSIRKCIMTAANLIQQGTLGVVSLNELYVVMNPNTAKVVSTSQEWIDFIKQSPSSLAVWQGDAQFNTYNIPSQLFGLNVVIDDSVYNSALPGVTASLAYTFPDNFCSVVTKQQAIQSAFGAAFSTFELFAYADLETFVYNDVKNRRYEIQITDNTDASFLFAPSSGAIIETNS